MVHIIDIEEQGKLRSLNTDINFIVFICKFKLFNHQWLIRNNAIYPSISLIYIIGSVVINIPTEPFLLNIKNLYHEYF